MSKNIVDPGIAQAQVELRRARILSSLDRPADAVAVDAEPLPADRMEFLRNEAEELFWNELAWEELTDDELVGGGHFTELVFPAFLAFADGLLLEEVAADSRAPARPHPEAVEEILVFLAERHAALSAELEAGVDSHRVAWARAMTSRLIDLVLYRLYRLTPAERERIEAGA